MRRIFLLFTGMALLSGCATHVAQAYRTDTSAVGNKSNPVRGVTQETVDGKARFTWCGACSSPTPKAPARPGRPAKDTSAKKANVGSQRQPAAVIHFDFNSAAIKPSEAIKLSRLLKDIGANTTLILRGYTDAAGGKAYNQRLAWRRAQAVRRWLSTHTKQQVRYDIRAYGKCCYARQPGLSPENRRVEIYINKESER